LFLVERDQHLEVAERNNAFCSFNSAAISLSWEIISARCSTELANGCDSSGAAAWVGR
jgi:hypothetical protein